MRKIRVNLSAQNLCVIECGNYGYILVRKLRMYFSAEILGLFECGSFGFW